MRISVRSGDHVGTTAFFRNRALLETVFDWLVARGYDSAHVLFHACSIGAEPYSFLIYNEAHVRPRHALDLRCDATDIDPEFVAAAAAGEYEARQLVGVPRAERRFFLYEDGRYRVCPEIRARVAFLAASSFAAFAPPRSYDLVFLLNALTYVDAATQARAIDAVARYNTGLLVTSAFHMDTIEADLRRNGYRPVLDHIEAIHNGWTDRVNWTAAPEIMALHHTSPFLPPFSRIPGFEYRYCALFEKDRDGTPTL